MDGETLYRKNSNDNSPEVKFNLGNELCARNVIENKKEKKGTYRKSAIKLSTGEITLKSIVPVGEKKNITDEKPSFIGYKLYVYDKNSGKDCTRYYVKKG